MFRLMLLVRSESHSPAALEELHGPLVLPGGGEGRERSKIPPLACSRVFLARVQTVFTAGEFPDHAEILGSGRGPRVS